MGKRPAAGTVSSAAVRLSTTADIIFSGGEEWKAAALSLLHGCLEGFWKIRLCQGPRASRQASEQAIAKKASENSTSLGASNMSRASTEVEQKSGAAAESCWPAAGGSGWHFFCLRNVCVSTADREVQKGCSPERIRNSARGGCDQI